MNSFDLKFFRHAGSSYQKQSACNIEVELQTRKRTFISKVLSQVGLVYCFTERDFLEVQIVISPFMFEILKNGFQLLSLPSFENVKNMLECEQIMALVQGDGCCWIN